MSEQARASFGGKLSAILVAAGSAIGLGSIWRFPYVAGENGFVKKSEADVRERKAAKIYDRLEEVKSK